MNKLNTTAAELIEEASSSKQSFESFLFLKRIEYLVIDKYLSGKEGFFVVYCKDGLHKFVYSNISNRIISEHLTFEDLKLMKVHEERRRKDLRLLDFVFENQRLKMLVEN